MQFCSNCGHKVQLAVPEGDLREREVCPSCGVIYYENPKVLVSCIVYKDDRILWIKRAIEPNKGQWAIPAGFMEAGESLQEAACRELHEETQVSCAPTDLHLYGIGSLPRLNEVYVAFRVKLLHEHFQPGDEAEEVALLPEDAVPWNTLAYPSIAFTVRDFYRELRANTFGIYVATIEEHQIYQSREASAAAMPGIRRARDGVLVK